MPNSEGGIPIPLFQEEWWLDAATAGRWDLATVLRDGVVVASLPFVVRRRAGLRYIEHPPYTRTIAPQLRLPSGKLVTQLGSTVKLLGELMARLPRHDRLELILDPDVSLAFPFVALGYLVSHHYTFVAPFGSVEDALWKAIEQKTRNVVATASKRFAVSTHTDLDRFMNLSRKEHKTERRNNHDFKIISRIFDACVTRGRCTVITASDDQGDVAASVVVCGGGKAYHWLSARDPQRAGAGGGSLLIWEGIRLALSQRLTFDADSFRTTNSALFLSRFGLRPAVRPVVNWGSRAWRIAFLVKTALRPNRADLFYRT